MKVEVKLGGEQAGITFSEMLSKAGVYESKSHKGFTIISFGNNKDYFSVTPTNNTTMYPFAKDGNGGGWEKVHDYFLSDKKVIICN